MEPFAPRVVGSLPPVEEFSAPVYDQVHQEQIAACVMTENVKEIPVVQEQVIVQEIPDVIVPRLPVEEFSAPVFDQVHQEQIAASKMTENIAEIPVVQEQVIVGTRPERLVDTRGPQRCDRTVRSTSVGAPVFAVQSLRGFDGVDDTAAKFLGGGS